MELCVFLRKIIILIGVSCLLSSSVFCQETDPMEKEIVDPPGAPNISTPVLPPTASMDLEPVFITISARHRTAKHGTVVVEKEIQLNWYAAGAGNDTFDTVVLYTEDPVVFTNATPVVSINITDHPSGFYQTNVSIAFTPLPGGWENTSKVSNPESGEQCMPYWVGTVANEVPQFLTCLKIQPTWMYDHRDLLGHLSLLDLLIPGTHDSACYKKIDLSNIGDIVTENSVTQDVDVWGQMVYGVRYINLQTSYQYKKRKLSGPVNPMNFYVGGNDVIQIRPLVPILEDIRTFLEMSQHEIIFLDFQWFPAGMKYKHHKSLIDLLNRQFGDIASPRPEHFLKVPRLDTMWSENKQIIIFYGEPKVVHASPILWEPLHHFNGRMQTLSGLHHYMSGIMARREETTLTKGLWNVMAHLSPHPLALYSHPEQTSFRALAESSNRNISEWFAQKWWRNASIVSTDFFLNTNLVNIAIQANVYKGLTMNGTAPEVQYSSVVEEEEDEEEAPEEN